MEDRSDHRIWLEKTSLSSSVVFDAASGSVVLTQLGAVNWEVHEA